MANVTGQAQATERPRGDQEANMNITSSMSQGGAFRAASKNRLDIRSNRQDVPPSSKQSSRARSRGEQSVQRRTGKARDTADPAAATRPKKDTSAIHYDKIRYPGYKELIYRKKNQEHLPAEQSRIQKLLGLGGPLDMHGSQEKPLKENRSGHIEFDADFECGNIDQVRQRSPVEYDLWMRNDTNGSSNLQWFYFRM